MLRRTLCRRVELFSTLVPKALISVPNIITDQELGAIKQALDERKAMFQGVELFPIFESITNLDNAHKQQKAIKDFSEVVDQLRGHLYKKETTDPFVRLVLHEAIMAAGFYQRSINTNELQGEGIRFVVNHYGFDVRRDTIITKKVHESLLEEKVTTQNSEQLLRHLLLLERHLSGKYRFHPVGGRRWFTLGLALSELHTEKELNRVLNLPVVKSHGNFSMTIDEKEKLWKTIKVQPREESFTSFAESAKLMNNVRDKDMVYELRAQKPAPEVPYWEQVKERALQIWVLLFAVWISFWAVDEEVITLIALIFLKHRQTKILEEEAEKNGGGKIYIAASTGHMGK